MRLLNMQGLWPVLLIPLILLLYFKKHQEKEIKISSIKIWDEVLKEAEGIRTKNINKYLLLFLEIMIVISIALALSDPYLVKGKAEDEITVFLDSSISMNSVEKGKSHFQLAKEEINKFLHTLKDDVRINLVLIDSDENVLLERGSKKEGIDILKKISCSDFPLNLNKFSEIKSQFDGEKVFITDKDVNFDGSVIKVGKDFDNLGITYGYYDYYNGDLIYKIKNYSSKRKEVHISISDEEGNKAIDKWSIGPGEEKDMFFHPKKEKNVFIVSIENEDSLSEDNKYTIPVGQKYKKSVVLVGDNLFFDSALKSIPQINYVKKDKISSGDKKFDLYIFADNQSAENNIEDSGVWYLDPEWEISGLKTRTEEIHEDEGSFLSDLDMSKTYVNNAKYLKDIKNFHPLLKGEGGSFMVYGMKKGEKVMYSSLDFNNTNFVMTPYFPIVIKESIGWFFDGDYLLDKEEFTNPPSQLVVGDMNNRDANERKAVSYTPLKPIKNYSILLALVLLVMEWKVYKNAF